jgi:hypothetical protein
VPAKGLSFDLDETLVVAMGEERSELDQSRHEQSAVASFAKASRSHHFASKNLLIPPPEMDLKPS